MHLDQQLEDDPLRILIVDGVDKALEGAFELYDLDTMNVKDASAEEAYFKAFDEQVELTIGKLCKNNIFLLDIDYKKEIHSLIAEEGRRLSLIWETLRRKVENRIELLVDYHLKTSNLSLDRYSHLVDDWNYILSNCRNFIGRVLPCFQYIALNYPSIAKEVNRRLKISDYFIIYLINLLKTKLNQDFELLLESFLSRQRSHTPLDKKYLNYETPLTLMFRYKILVDHNTNLSVGSFYLRSVQTYVTENLKIPINLHYRESLTKILVHNALISGSISASLVANCNDIILRHTIMDKDTTYLLLKVILDNTEIMKPASRAENLANQLFAILVMAYESRSMIDELWGIYRALVSSSLSSIEGSNERQLQDACKLLLIASKSEYMEKQIHDEVTRGLKGPVGIMERYLKLCESAIRKFNQIKSNALQTDYDKSLATNLPLIMKVPSSFLTLYCRSLFRRYVVHGINVIDTLLYPAYFEYHLLSLFERLYGSSPEYDGLQTLKAELLRSAQITESFAEAKNDHTLIPLLFEKKGVPSAIQKSLEANLVLPSEMQRYWDIFQTFFKTHDEKAKFKKLHLIDCFQHCEVQTQIRSADSRFLTLDLTLYQTCILDLFNDESALSINEISSRSNMADDLLHEVLDSFMRIGLFKLKENLVMLDEDFIPDERKIKNGKLRVPMQSIRARSSRENSAEIVQHMEGLSSHWKQEMIKACIVRSLKGEKSGMKFDTIYAKVESQMFGISTGEFKDALNRAVLDKAISQWRDFYKY